MDWVEPFSTRQHAWLVAAGFDAAEAAADRVGLLRRVVPPAARVLELGAGRCETASAAANAGYRVVAVELIADAAGGGRAAAAALSPGTLDVHTADMYTVDIPGSFDVVCYRDGFGIGGDADQRHLLRRIAGWLSPDGAALVENWPAVAGREQDIGPARRRYGFDPDGSRMLDVWWLRDAPDTAVVQSLRCYAPADLRLVLEGTGLRLDTIEPGGGRDAATDAWFPQAPLERAMSYVAILRPV